MHRKIQSTTTSIASPDSAGYHLLRYEPQSQVPLWPQIDSSHLGLRVLPAVTKCPFMGCYSILSWQESQFNGHIKADIHSVCTEIQGHSQQIRHNLLCQTWPLLLCLVWRSLRLSQMIFYRFYIQTSTMYSNVKG